MFIEKIDFNQNNSEENESGLEKIEKAIDKIRQTVIKQTEEFSSKNIDCLKELDGIKQEKQEEIKTEPGILGELDKLERIINKIKQTVEEQKNMINLDHEKFLEKLAEIKPENQIHLEDEQKIDNIAA
jgi:cysteinyl-tRNA synthetase